ncbi:MAG: LytTR family transcriptional regulator [Verrucomicrobia bacterium]|nr:LytTR family transcriptional regulator [Verrucomicrobiota bacterium]
MIENPTGPFDPALPPALARKLTEFRRRHPERLAVRSEGSIHLLRCAEIDWIEAQGDYARFHLADWTCLVRMTMRTLASHLDPARFLRIHRSRIVNVDRIERISRDAERGYCVQLRDQRRLRIGEHYLNHVRRYLLTVPICLVKEPDILAPSPVGAEPVLS